MTRILVAAAACLLALHLAAGPAAARDVTLRDEMEKSLPFPAGGTLVLENRHGSVTVVGWDRDEIEVSAELKAEAEDEDAARRVLERLEVKVESGPRGVEVRTDSPRLAELTGDVYGSVRYTVSVPAGAGLEVSTVDGGVLIQGVRGAIEARTVNGPIEVTGAGDRVDVRGANGSVRVEVGELSPSGRISAVTANGGVIVVLPPGADADFEARTRHGSITTDFPATVQGETSKTRLAGRIGEGGATLTLETANGSVEIRARE